MGRFLNSLESTNGKKSLFFCENLLLQIVVGAEDGEEGGDDRINNGGMANANYARLQYDGLSVTEKERLKNALLHYCELDTMAMVLIYEFFKIHSVNPPGF